LTNFYCRRAQNQRQITKLPVKKLSTAYGLKDIIFTGDRGMLTQKRIDEVNESSYNTVTALTHPQIESLIEKLCHPIKNLKT
jgi:hypothetical protein